MGDPASSRTAVLALGGDLATLGVGLPPGAQLGHAATLMGATPWPPASQTVLARPARRPHNQPAAWLAGAARGGKPG